MKYAKDAFGSRLEITIMWDDKNDSGVAESFLYVEQFEEKYSRFKADNILSEINTWKKCKLDSEITSLIHLCKKVSSLTQWYFDITILPLLENAGYWISATKLPQHIWYKNIELQDDVITLHNGVQIEFGSYGKGYMLDVIYNILQKYHSSFVIDFWGDIRVSGKKKIYLEDPWNTSKNIWSIILKNLSIASSSWNKRVLEQGHHLINPINIKSQSDKIAVYVTHKLWVFADIFATALFVAPLELSLKVLESVEWLEALIIWADGKIFKSQWFITELTL